MGDVALEYVAAGGNRHSSAADWGSNLLAFGTGNNIALWKTDDKKSTGISSVLIGHTDTVNVVRFYDLPSSRYILSGSTDKSIRIWAISPPERAANGSEVLCLQDHKGSINTISILEEVQLFVSGSADGTVKIWHFEDDYSTAKLLQTISLKPHYLPLTTAITSLSNGDVTLAVAGTSNIIQLFVQSKQNGPFELQATLRGHEGWIRSLDFIHEVDQGGSDVLLASASQDKFIRLWRFHETPLASVSKSGEMKDPLSNKTHEVGNANSKHTVTFEALLVGHEDWVYTVRWMPVSHSNSGLTLLSASADNSLAIWNADPGSGLWVCSTRLGEISSQKGSSTATGSTGGFWIGLWQPQGRSVVSLGRSGSWRRWTYDVTHDMWKQQLGISGHVRDVQSLAWARDGSYLLSTGSDQTTRMYAGWRRDEVVSWHEFARPQIHGYDLNCIEVVTDDQFISGADEKLLRVFDKPRAVGYLLSRLSLMKTSQLDRLPDAANLPVLGLSNKVVESTDGEDKDAPENAVNGMSADASDAMLRTSMAELNHPPYEDDLSRHTLWPEKEKLYGHGYEISTLATSHDASLIATACKASSIDHAVIRLYETKDWREVKPPLTAHSLTVTSLEFSPDDAFLLSTGRDRQWSVFERDRDARNTYKPYASDPRGHSRMILGCSWAPTSAGTVFATAGRDKCVKIWRLAQGRGQCVATISMGGAATAVAFSQSPVLDQLALACASEDGQVVIAHLLQTTFGVIRNRRFPRELCPSKTVNSLQWQPGSGETGRQLLATASDDFTVRIYNVEMTSR